MSTTTDTRQISFAVEYGSGKCRAIPRLPVGVHGYSAREAGEEDRAIAAWNAVDTIPTDALQPGSVRYLVEASRRVVDIVDPDTDIERDIWRALRAALAPFESP